MKSGSEASMAKQERTEKEIVVIYDGQCRFCIASLKWLQQKLDLTAHSFQEADLTSYGLTREQCSKEVFALADGETYSGAAAIAVLLHQRGNTWLATSLRTFPKLSSRGYRWVASHRNSLLIRIVTGVLERSNAKN